jgi:hypothetical protein
MAIDSDVQGMLFSPNRPVIDATHINEHERELADDERIQAEVARIPKSGEDYERRKGEKWPGIVRNTIRKERDYVQQASAESTSSRPDYMYCHPPRKDETICRRCLEGLLAEDLSRFCPIGRYRIMRIVQIGPRNSCGYGGNFTQANPVRGSEIAS